MSTRHVLRIVLSGTALGGRRDQIATTIAVSAADRACGGHLRQAEFRARVRGLSAPWEVLEVHDVAQVQARTTL